MKISLTHLQDWIDLHDKSAEEIAEALTSLGLEIDDITESELPFTGVVVARILACKQHPDADRLKVATVSDGNEEYQIVCGGANCREGITVALAKVGATITDPSNKVHKIKKGKMRGVDSYGMLCAEEELGLCEKSDGILELDETLALGKDLREIYGDKVFEISLTPNLGHCLSLRGVARELAAFYQRPLKERPYTLSENSEKTTDHISIEIKDPKACPHYACRLVKGVKNRSTPEWMKQRLEASGFSSGSLIIDIGNYVMLEIGQPLHMFDFAKISGGKIYATTEFGEGEFDALTGQKHPLPKGALVISDSKEALALGGVMGGISSAVNDSTQDVLIEAALFAPSSIRRTCRLSGIHSDASHRFERGVDPLAINEALDRAAYFLQILAEGSVCEGISSQIAIPYTPRKIACRIHRVNALLGTNLSASEIRDLLTLLEIEILKEEDGTLFTHPPSYRNDLNIEEDLIEEIARLYGYNNLPSSAPRPSVANIPHSPLYLFENTLRQALIAEGLQEWITCDLISPKLAKLSDEAGQIAVLHPSSVDQSIMRKNLLSSMIPSVQKNSDQQIHTIHAFELGKVHLREESKLVEQLMAGIILKSEEAPHHWESSVKAVNFYTLKGIVENLLMRLRLPEATFVQSAIDSLHPKRQAHIEINSQRIGTLGEMHPLAAREHGIKGRLYFAQLNAHSLHDLYVNIPTYTALPIYPGSTRDWTLTLNRETPAYAVISAIKDARCPLLEEVKIRDLYTSKDLGEEKKNLTLRLSYRDAKKTLSQEKVEKEHEKIKSAVAKKLADCILSSNTQR